MSYLNRKVRLKMSGERGIAAVELALILPLMLIIVFGVIDFGGLIHSRLIVTNVSREGGSLASRNIKLGNDLVGMLQESGKPLDLKEGLGRIYITTIMAGWLDSEGIHTPYIPTVDGVTTGGNLVKSSSVGNNKTNLGLSSTLYDHLKVKDGNVTSDIDAVIVVEVFYKYRPITPLPKIIFTFFDVEKILLTDGDGTIIGSKAVFEGVK
jgi:hypothetical protein